MKESNFQFINPYLTEMEFKINPNFISQENNDFVEMQNDFNTEIKRKKNENKAEVVLSLKINENIKNAPFFLKITVASNFVWDNIEEDKVKIMLQYNAPSLLVGYMRPIVANVTNSSIFPAYNLPFINFRE